jgi:uncharacterized membrane protein YdjX (TVP38/TMEM64 family)
VSDRAAIARSLGRAFVVTGGATVLAWLLSRHLDATTLLHADSLRVAVGADRWYGPILYVGAFVAAMFLPVPKIMMIGLAGVLFGPVWGFACAWAGQVVGMTALFVVARTGFRDLAQQLVLAQVEAARRIDLHLASHGTWVVAALRLFYFMGTPLSIMLSTTRLPLPQFVTGTAIGVVPAVAVAVASGDAVVSGASGITAAVIGVGLVLVGGLGTLVRRRFGI